MSDSLQNNDRLRSWLNHEPVEGAFPGDEDLKRMLEASARLEVPQGMSKEEAWQRFAERIEIADESPAKIRRFPWAAVSAAAMIVLLLAGSWLFWPQTDIALRTPKAQQSSFLLPDGSRVSLNADSEVMFSEEDWENERTLSLSGEAFFEVVPGAPFTVKTQSGMVEVLGTSFNVFAREESIHVSCLTGKVSVGAFGQAARVLSPGEAMKASSEGMFEVFSFEEKNPISWQKGEFYFEKTPINHVIAVLERQYDVEIEGLESSDRTYTGYFTNQNLEEALKLVCMPLGISYHLLDSRRIRLEDAAVNE